VEKAAIGALEQPEYRRNSRQLAEGPQQGNRPPHGGKGLGTRDKIHGPRLAGMEAFEKRLTVRRTGATQGEVNEINGSAPVKPPDKRHFLAAEGAITVKPDGDGQAGGRRRARHEDPGLKQRSGHAVFTGVCLAMLAASLSKRSETGFYIPCGI